MRKMTNVIKLKLDLINASKSSRKLDKKILDNSNFKESTEIHFQTKHPPQHRKNVDSENREDIFCLICNLVVD